MEKEIENLITENNELLATKNALNIVKDDLIAKVDELQSELTMCANEIQQRDAVKERLKSRIISIEDELKKCKEENEELKQKLAAPKEVWITLTILHSTNDNNRTTRKVFLWLRGRDLLELRWREYLWNEISTKKDSSNYKKPFDGQNL